MFGDSRAVEILRHLLAIGSLPFVVTVVVPAYLILAGESPNIGWNLAPPIGIVPTILGCVLVGLGLLLVYETVSLFAKIGKGTLAPWDPPQKLVVRGPYRYVRNPMISGVLSILLGEAIVFGSVPVLLWFLAFFVVNALVMPLIEEPKLESRFGDDYVAYKRAVPRWIPRLRPPRPHDRSPLRFFVLVFVLSLPFWLLGPAVQHLFAGFPVNLPASALMFVCPLVAALILVRKERGARGVRRLLVRVFDFGRIRRKMWYLPILFLMPAIALVSYGWMRLAGLPLPEPRIKLLAIPVFFVVFSVSAACEEVGWMGYAADPLQRRWSALGTGVVLGSVWALWHTVPYAQAGRSLAWILWQSLFTVAARVLIVWLYDNTQGSLFSAVLFHAMIDVSVFSFPNYGSHYDPAIFATTVMIATVAVVGLWGPRTLARNRFAGR